MSVDLTYYIFEGLLVGLADGQVIHTSAYSGGGAGSTRYRPSYTANNPYYTGLRTGGTGTAHIHGGPIPVGRYRVYPPTIHPHLGRSARLESERLSDARGGFYIHGTGPHGSDGCIVPLNRDALNTVLDALERGNGGKLVVCESSLGSSFA